MTTVETYPHYFKTGEGRILVRHDSGIMEDMDRCVAQREMLVHSHYVRVFRLIARNKPDRYFIMTKKK